MEKKVIITLLGAVVIILAVAAGIKFYSAENNWVCENNQWIKRGHPIAAMPQSNCGDNLIGGQTDEHDCLIAAGYSWCPSTQRCQRMWEEYCEEYKDQYRGTSTEITSFAECAAAGNPVMESFPRQCSFNGQTFIEEIGSNANINLISPLANEIITSPLTIKGEAKGAWYFEAQFPIKLEDEEGNVLAQTAAHAQGEWMTENMVPFTAEVTFNPSDKEKGFLILEKDNPSGLPENADSIKVPVLFKGESIAVKIFFSNDSLDPQISCNKVFPVERTITKTDAIGRATLEQLLIGPTEVEEINAYVTSINSGVKINSLNIENGLAKVDFSSEIEQGVGGSCKVSAIRSQITETLKQFPSVREVVISVDGRTEDALQP